MSEPSGIDDATLKTIIARASRYQLLRRSQSSTSEVIAIAAELGLEEAVVRQAIRDIHAERQARQKARRPKMITAGVLVLISLLWALALMGDDEPSDSSSEPTPQVVAVAPPPTKAPPPRPKPTPKPEPEPKGSDDGPDPIEITGSPKLSKLALKGAWHLKSYQMAMDGRSVEIPLRHDPQGLHAERETWTLRGDGTFTHRFSTSLWFSGKWRLGGVAKIPDPLRPSKDLEVVHLITEEVTTSMMKQRPIEHHLVSLTRGKELITWYAGQSPPTLRALKQGHRFERVSP